MNDIWTLIGAALMFLVVIVLNLALLAAAVWVVVQVLQATGTI